jgi:mono/diheme cytochrome c family protein
MRAPASKLTISFAATLVALLAVASFAEPVRTPAAKRDSPPVDSAFEGAKSYRTYCANCHGPAGAGDGYLADTLAVPPADLTLLAKRNGGVFPAERVAAAIDGRDALREHGRREMPAWGDLLLWPEGDSVALREQVRQRIRELVAHLRTLQVR